MSRLFPTADEVELYVTDPLAMPRKAVPFIIYFLRLLKLPLALCMACGTVATICTALEPYFFGRLVDALAHNDGEVIGQQILIIVGLYMLISQLISRVLYSAANKFELFATPMLMMVVRRHLANYLFRHSYRYFSDDFVGRLGGKVMEMPQAVKEVITDLLNPFQYVMVTGLTSLVLFASLHWSFGVAAFSFFAVTGWFCKWRLPHIIKAADRSAATKQTLRGYYIDSIGGILLVKLFARHRAEDMILTKSLSIAGGAEQTEGLQYRVLWKGQHVINAVFQAVIMGLCIKLYLAKLLTLGGIAIALSTGAMLAAHIWWLLFASTLFFGRFATIDEALDTILQPHEITDAAGALPLQPDGGTIAFNDVMFTYPKGRNLFTHLNLHIPAGQKVGLVGYSGSGKTSFVRLILRLYDIQAGSITIDGHNIATVTQDTLHKAISFIPQEPELFHRTVSENIAVGKPGATQDEIVAAAKRASAHDFISNLPQGYDSVVGERGVKLSGGQRQRIAIARVALVSAPVLIMDEATSALDSQTEQEVQESLGNLMQGRTTIVIAHRLATLKHMDRILVFNEGQIVEDGTVEGLLQQGGIFKNLWDAQVGGFLRDQHSHHV